MALSQVSKKGALELVREFNKLEEEYIRNLQNPQRLKQIEKELRKIATRGMVWEIRRCYSRKKTAGKKGEEVFFSLPEKESDIALQKGNSVIYVQKMELRFSGEKRVEFPLKAHKIFIRGGKVYSEHFLTGGPTRKVPGFIDRIRQRLRYL